MDQFLLLAAFILSCSVILVCFTKKQMFVARTIFLSLGIFVVFTSSMLIYAEYSMGDTPLYGQRQSVATFVTYMLGISTVLVDVVIVTIVAATVILSVFVVTQIVRYFQNRRTRVSCGDRLVFNLPQVAFLPPRRFFILFCRWLN